MAEKILLLTGHLAEASLARLVGTLDREKFAVRIVNIGVKVAALMTEAIVRRRLSPPLDADRVIFPGRAGLDPARLSAHFGVSFERGPDELGDLPGFLGLSAGARDLSRHDIRLFAEIVEAAELDLPALLTRARALIAEGADVIDLGCRPGRKFPDLEAKISALRAEGMRVSVDSADPNELRRGALAGADFLLSLTEATLSLVHGTQATPVLIPARHGDLASLVRAAEKAQALGIAYLVDPILDPIHSGFSASLARYSEIRRLLPKAEILMGTGNLTELTDADSAGVTALLLGICSELGIRNVLTVQVSPHTRRTLAEHDVARRMLFAARADGALPRFYSEGLLQVHDRMPYPQRPDEIAAFAESVRDENYRIMVAEDGIHVFNGTRHFVREDALSCYPDLAPGLDPAHAFYLGAELAKAEIAFRLGKRYVQDEMLSFGIATQAKPAHRTRLAEAGHTLRARNDAAHS
jgi:dihydropteroate synthase